MDALRDRLAAAEAQARQARQLAQAAHRDSARLVRLLNALARPAPDTAALLTSALETLSEAFDADVVCLVREAVTQTSGSRLPVVVASCGFPAGAPTTLPDLPAELAAATSPPSAGAAPASSWVLPRDAGSDTGPDLHRGPAFQVAGVGIRSAARLALDPHDAQAGAVLMLRAEPTGFTITELKLLQSVVARLHATLQATERRTAAELLARTGDRFTRHREVGDLFTDAVGLLVELTGAEWAGVLELDEGRAHLRAQGGELGLDLSPAWPRPSSALLGWSELERGRSVCTHDLGAVPDHPDAPPRSEARTVLSVPVTADGRVQAVLMALHRTPSAFSRVAREAVEQLSTCLSAAVVSARLHAALESSEQLSRHRATHDPLTGLANRALVREELDRRLAGDPADQAGTSHPTAVGVLFCDLDDFKAVNDRLGHDAGDQLLRQAATRLLATTRPGDVLARLGGDEFVVLLDPVRSTREVHQVGERLLDALRAPFDITGHRGVTESVLIGCSLGGALAERGEHPQQRAADLLCNADAAMYDAKREGGRRTHTYDGEAARRAQHAAELAHDITRAVERGEIHVAHQPVWALTGDPTGDRPVGVEALARWTHPTHGPVRPDVFIPQAERSTAIIGIGRLVLVTALDDLVRWERDTGARLTLAVNASPVELDDPRYADRVLAHLSGASIDPRRLRIEITEGLPLLGAALQQLTRLRTAGVQVLIDDFGVSHSDLARLKSFPVDGLKIDKSLIDGLSTAADADPMDRGIVDAVLTLARTAGLSVIAEGVETPAQHAALTELGCTLAQGWLMSPPLPAAQMTALLTAGRSPAPAHLHR